MLAWMAGLQLTETQTQSLFLPSDMITCQAKQMLWGPPPTRKERRYMCCRKQYSRNQAPHSENWRTQVYYADEPRGVNTPSSEPWTKGLQSFFIHGQAWLTGFEGLQGLRRLQRAGQEWVSSAPVPSILSPHFLRPTWSRLCKEQAGLQRQKEKEVM